MIFVRLPLTQSFSASLSAVVAAFEQMKREFEFNISASVNFDLDANISQSLQQMSQDIMEEVSSELQLFQRLGDPLKYCGLVLVACSYLRSERDTSPLTFPVTRM